MLQACYAAMQSRSSDQGFTEQVSIYGRKSFLPLCVLSANEIV